MPKISNVAFHVPTLRLGGVRIAADFVWRRMPKRVRLPRWLYNPYNAAMLILLVIVAVSGLVWRHQQGGGTGGFKLVSPSFQNGGKLPANFTCDGENISPEFTIMGVPKKAKTLAFIIEDKDLDTKQYKDYQFLAHEMVWNIPASTTKFTQGIRPPGTIGRNLYGNFAYGGPCPPEGKTHDYTFTLYAIDKDSLPINSEAGLAEAKKVIEQYSIDSTKLTVSYTRVKK